MTIADPPTKEVLRQIFMEKLQEEGGQALNLLEYIRTKDVNKAWLINMIFVIDSQNDIFDSSYRAPKKPTMIKDSKQKEIDKFEAYRNAFLGIPMPSKKDLQKKATVGGTIKREKKMTKMQMMQAQLDELRAAQ